MDVTNAVMKNLGLVTSEDGSGVNVRVPGQSVEQLQAHVDQLNQRVRRGEQITEVPLPTFFRGEPISVLLPTPLIRAHLTSVRSAGITANLKYNGDPAVLEPL